MGAAVRHLFAPLAASTLTTVLGFMPVFLLPGNVGDFVGPIAISVVLALLASFVVSVTVIAALAGRFAPAGSDSRGQRWWREGLSSTALTARYRALLAAALGRPLITLGLGLTLPALGFGLTETSSRSRSGWGRVRPSPAPGIPPGAWRP